MSAKPPRRRPCHPGWPAIAASSVIQGWDDHIVLQILPQRSVATAASSPDLIRCRHEDNRRNASNRHAPLWRSLSPGVSDTPPRATRHRAIRSTGVSRVRPTERPRRHGDDPELEGPPFGSACWIGRRTAPRRTCVASRPTPSVRGDRRGCFHVVRNERCRLAPVTTTVRPTAPNS